MSTGETSRDGATRGTPTLRDVVVAGHLGDHRLVAEATGSADAAVREAALGALHRLGTLDDARITASLGDPDRSVRRRAAELAATHPSVRLLAALHDPDAGVVEMAAWSCGEQGDAVDDEVLERLIELTTTADDPLVRESCAAALGAIGDPRGLPAILAACTDKPAVRRRAVLALAPFIDSDTAGDPVASDPVDGGQVAAAIERALGDRDWQVRQSAEDLRRPPAP